MAPWKICSLLFCLTLPAFAGDAPKIAAFSPLTGPYSVGARQFVWVDKDRQDPYSSNTAKNRTVTVQVWYPIPKTDTAPDAPYLLSALEFLGDNVDAATIRSFNEKAQTRSHLNASVAPGKFPVLLFNPGGGMPRFTSSFVTEQLASHGYVVFAIEHYGYSHATNYPDGSPLNLDLAPVFKNPEMEKKIADGTASIEEIKASVLADWQKREDLTFPVCLDDTRFALAQIEKLNAKGRFAAHLDLSRIGTLGWSQGGAESMHLLVHDPRVKATVDLDGQFMGKDKETWQSDKPFMLLHSMDPHEPNPNMDAAMKELTKLTASWNEHMFTTSTGPRFEALISDSDHGNFSDYLIFYSHFASEEKREKARAREQLISKLTVSFFNTYLAGKPEPIPLNDPLVASSRSSGVNK